MVRRTTTLLAALVLLSAVSAAAGAVIDAPPELTFSNEADTTYRVTVYTAEDLQTAMYLNFAVTTDSGDRRLATLSQLVWPTGFRNVTLADDGVPTRRVTVEPGEEVTTTVRGWTPGNVTVYVVEDLGDDERHVMTEVISCTEREQTHSWTFEGGSGHGSSRCASGVDWLLPK